MDTNLPQKFYLLEQQNIQLPTRDLRYLTLGKETSASKIILGGDMIVPRRVNSIVPTHMLHVWNIYPHVWLEFMGRL